MLKNTLKMVYFTLKIDLTRPYGVKKYMLEKENVDVYLA